MLPMFWQFDEWLFRSLSERRFRVPHVFKSNNQVNIRGAIELNEKDKRIE